MMVYLTEIFKSVWIEGRYQAKVAFGFSFIIIIETIRATELVKELNKK